VVVKHVAFEGCWTGRRFLACPGEVCVRHDLSCSYTSLDLMHCVVLTVDCHAIYILGWRNM
jgi:hypothetical protein